MFLALMIGNSRLHWGRFEGKTLYRTWNSDYLALDELPSVISSPPDPLFLASVVPRQTEIWQNYPNVRIITLNEIPLRGLYPTLGIDRALALLGAGRNWGFPMLVIDAGTALTFTGANANHTLVGGAILPGLGLQIATLAQKTGQLPLVDAENFESVSLPSRFALNTEEAIQSGVIYTLLAGIKDFIETWWQSFPDSSIAMTGGDAELIFNYLRSPLAAPFGASHYPEIGVKLNIEPNLIFWGMGEIIDRYQL
jgi:type III pantothenate kinase